MKSRLIPGFMALTVLSTAVGSAADDGKPWPEAQIEIFRLAPGKHEAFMRAIASWDIVSAAGGQASSQVFVHQEGASWDVLLLKPYPRIPVTPVQQAAMDAKAREMHLETGPAYFLAVRELVAEHTESRTFGPLTASQWVARLDAVRAESGGVQESHAKERPR